MPEPHIVLITGGRQAGKSTLCLRLARGLRQCGIAVSGLLTRQTGPHDLEVLELLTGKAYPLTLPWDATRPSPLGNFQIDPLAFARSDQSLEGCFPTQVLVMDELGPLELIYNQGWARVLRLMKCQSFSAAFVVVRSELLIQAIWQLPASVYIVVSVDRMNRDELSDSLLQMAQELCSGSGDSGEKK